MPSSPRKLSRCVFASAPTKTLALADLPIYVALMLPTAEDLAGSNEIIRPESEEPLKLYPGNISSSASLLTLSPRQCSIQTEILRKEEGLFQAAWRDE